MLAYKLTVFLINNLKTFALYFNTFNVKNTKQLLHDIQQIPLDGKLKFAAFDIISVYIDIQNKQV
jgi:hypothetical protein